MDLIDVRERTFRRWQPTGEGVLKKPINCTIDPATGWLYVADTERLQVVIFDETLAYRTAFDIGGGTPTDVFVDGDRILVTDIRGGKVLTYDKATHALLASFPDEGAPPGAVLRQPTNLWVHGDEIVVSDFGDFRVKVYGKDGSFRRRFGWHKPNSPRPGGDT